MVFAALTTFAALADAQSEFARSVSAYNRQLAAGNYIEAAKSAAAASAACVEVKNYEGAFNILTNADKAFAAKPLSADSIPEAYYRVAKAKFDIYQKLHNTGSAQTWLEKMIKYAGMADSKKITGNMLFSAAQFYYSINQTAKGDQCIARLIKQYDSAKDYKGADEAYKRIIDKAVSQGDAKLVELTYENYMKWSDSIDAINADTELGKVKKEYEQSQETIAEKDKTIRGKSGVIATFITLFVIALAALAVGVLFYLRVVAKNRKMKKNVEAANEQSAAKSAILHNLSSTMEPTLERLDQSDPAVQNLRGYVKRVGELSDVGDAEPKAPEALQDVNIEAFGNKLAQEVKPLLKPNVAFHMDMPKGIARIDEEDVHKILLHLLENAAKYTPEGGKVCLAYKKRGAKCHQFIVSDSGPGIPKDKRETLFKAFSTPDADLAEGDGLGLPICALRAEKLNGSLELDGDHSKGATFVLTIRG